MLPSMSRRLARPLLQASATFARAASTSAGAAAARRSPARALAVAAGGAVALAAGAGVAYADSAPAVWYNPLTWSFWSVFGSAPSTKGSAATVDYKALRADIEDLILDHACAPILTRLAWHASGTYDAKTKTGGSNGATMRYALEANDGANAGLEIARNLLEPLKAKYPGVTYADLWTFAGKVAVEYAGCSVEIPWKPGRVDYDTADRCPPNGRLPDASQGAQHIRDVFYRMGFNDQEIVALLGAHTLGRGYPDRSGYDGPWTRDENGFDNDFYRLLLNEKWVIRKNFQPTQYTDAATGELMMLPADMALVWDPKFRVWVEKYAADQDLFHRDFAKAYGKLLDLGVPRK